MIYPTRLMVVLAAAVAPVALLVGLLFPLYWTAGLALLALLLAMAVVDALSSAHIGTTDLACEGPHSGGVGELFSVIVEAQVRKGIARRAEMAAGVVGPVEAPFGTISPAQWVDGRASAAIAFRPIRRGTARIKSLWVRWQGALGLVWRQRQVALDQPVLILPDIRPVRDQGAQMLDRQSHWGIRAQRHVGEGAEFEALTEYRQGMDRRSIDWKTSARHTQLVAREYRTERNNNVILALDSGRTMCEPIDGIPRIDRAISAALLTAFVALKDGDRVGLYAFDSRPRAASAPISGERSFALLQRVAAGIDYSANETNYTLGLTALGSDLKRRSLIVLFTDFADTISAELMLASVALLLKRHLVLFLVLRDAELETFTTAEPETADDVSRAVIAAGLVRQRQLVLARLRHLGVHIVEAKADSAGPALVNAYLDLKRRSLL